MYFCGRSLAKGEVRFRFLYLRPGKILYSGEINLGNNSSRKRRIYEEQNQDKLYSWDDILYEIGIKYPDIEEDTIDKDETAC